MVDTLGAAQGTILLLFLFTMTLKGLQNSSGHHIANRLWIIIKNTQNEYGQIVNYLLAARRNDVTKLMQAFLEDFDLNSQGLIVIIHNKG